jgi:signal transduction histidine kinase
MYGRLIILSGIILAALCGLVWLGHHSIQIWAQGMEGARLGEFAAVAEQIRQDVKSKLDEFIQKERGRPYTDYLYYYVPENVVAGRTSASSVEPQQITVLRSPLNGLLENGLAYGNFQIEPDGKIVTPNDDLGQTQSSADSNDDFYVRVQANRLNIENNLLPALAGAAPGALNIEGVAGAESPQMAAMKERVELELTKNESLTQKGKKDLAFQSARGKSYPIESLQKGGQKAQVMEQRRSVYEFNIASNTASPQQAAADQPRQELQLPERSPTSQPQPQASIRGGSDSSQQTLEAWADVNTQQARLVDIAPEVNQPYISTQIIKESQAQRAAQSPQPAAREEQVQQQYGGQLAFGGDRGSQVETVQVRIEPFVPLVVPRADDESAEGGIFGGQVFLLRHVQIENKHFLQGFQLNEKSLVKEVEQSARRFVREGMSFELSQAKNGGLTENAAYMAVLDFGFGELALNLKEIDPARISKQIRQMQDWYLGIITIVLLAVTLGLASLWLNARAQIKLAQKKDDFISAVSHELRTPLTSIRMYAEMLEKNWVISKEKIIEYYKNMRQESERLSRLIENVLDFSRIQRKQKKYAFRIGEINKCISDVIEMMRPYAGQNGFSIRTEFEQVGQAAFDNDAVTQIVVNLLDNAVKYARSAEDKTITVRTKRDQRFILIEVEDHGPGIPHTQRKKVFEEFYRVGAEATRETTGTGLGLALVKKFAQAHNGFVEILTAKPTGSIFRVGLSAQA